MSDKRLEMEAMIFGFVLGDGHLSEKGSISFTGEKLGMENLRDDLKYLYKRENIGRAEIKKFYSESLKYGIRGTAHKFSSTVKVGRRYIELGCPTGNKVEKAFVLPEWIVNGSFEIKRNFISGLYSAEGYTPNAQVNRKTLRVLGFNMHRRERLKETLPVYIEQYKKILSDLGIKHTYKESERFTCEKNIRFELQFDNETENIMHVFSLLDLRYSTDKQSKIDQYSKYYQSKLQIIQRLKKVNVISLTEPYVSATELANEHKINRDLIYQWRKRKSGVRLPSSFPTFEEYQEQNLGELTGKSLESFLPSVFQQ